MINVWHEADTNNGVRFTPSSAGDGAFPNQNKGEKRMKILPYVIAFFIAAVNPSISVAQDIDMGKVIANWRNSAVELRLVLNDPGTYHIANLTEEEMNRYGCTYTVTDPQEINVLIGILEHGLIQAAPLFFKHGPDPRNGIYVQTTDGKSHKLVFTGKGYRPKIEYGTYDATTTIQANSPGLLNDLRAWALPREPQRGLNCRPEHFLPKQGQG